MPIDINILCVKQADGMINYNSDRLYLEKLNNDPSENKIYKDNWYLYNAILGIGYLLYIDENNGNTYDLVDYKETRHVANYMKNMVLDEMLPSNGNLDVAHCSVVFNKEYLDDFKDLLENFIAQSQINTCIVNFRLQVSCPERYVGRIGLNQFLEMLVAGEVYLNTAYIISKQEYD